MPVPRYLNFLEVMLGGIFLPLPLRICTIIAHYRIYSCEHLQMSTKCYIPSKTCFFGKQTILYINSIHCI